MSSMVKIAQFEGPLELLLKLVTEENLPLTDISLTEITENFLAEMKKMDDTSEGMADFLVLASRLLYLKSRILLPFLYPAEEDGGPGLVDQLKMYKRYVDASELIRDRWSEIAKCYGRAEPTKIASTEVVFPVKTDPGSLHKSMLTVLKRWKPFPKLPQLSIDKNLSVKETINSIVERLKELKRFEFSRLVGERPQKTEIIVHFLALLELCKRQHITVTQTGTFADLLLERV